MNVKFYGKWQQDGRRADGMNGFFLLIPFLMIRFGLLSYLNKDAVRRAAYFAPMSGNGIVAYWIYQISNTAIFMYLLFLKVKMNYIWLFFGGMVCYMLGLILCVFSVIGFSSPSSEGLNSRGIYRFSRNPMYVSYFICFTGCAFLTQSFILGGIVLSSDENKLFRGRMGKPKVAICPECGEVSIYLEDLYKLK